MYQQKKLKNGLPVLTIPMDGTKTVTVLVMFKTGSKYETRDNNGISHFLEHMFFKGTTKRPNTKDISTELDRYGSEYNAFTGKEYTGYYIKIDSAKVESALDIVSDMLVNSKFDEEEINREKGVIIEEINMYHENPMMHIEDMFEACLYGDTPSGWEIIGPRENIEKFSREDFVNYFKTQYGTKSASVCLAGKVENITDDMLEKYFGPLRSNEFIDKEKVQEAQSAPQILGQQKEGNQTNLSLGVRAYPMGHKYEYALKLLSVVLGGSMSSRLFLEVRERRGLAYYIRTGYETFTDAGYLTTQAGITAGKEKEAISVILNEYQKIAQEGVGVEEMQRTKDLIRGKSIIRLEASDDMANWYSRQIALGEEIKTPEEFFDKIDQVTAEELREVAQDIFKNEKLNLAIIGPSVDKESLASVVKF